MTAEEARKLNYKYVLTLQLDESSIDRKIELAASKGKTQTSISLTGIEYSYLTRIFETLKKLL